MPGGILPLVSHSYRTLLLQQNNLLLGQLSSAYLTVLKEFQFFLKSYF